MLKRRELARALPQRGLHAVDSTKRLMDDDQIEKLVSSARRLATLAQTILKCGSGNTHSESSGVRLPYPMGRRRCVLARAGDYRGIHTATPVCDSDDL
jgi:hypothetical protein